LGPEFAPFRDRMRKLILVDYKMRRGAKDRLFTRILEKIDGTQDRVGIAASTLNIEKMPPLSVTVGGQAGDTVTPR